MQTADRKQTAHKNIYEKTDDVQRKKTSDRLYGRKTDGRFRLKKREFLNQVILYVVSNRIMLWK
jgi:hypothetical protein